MAVTALRRNSVQVGSLVRGVHVSAAVGNLGVWEGATLGRSHNMVGTEQGAFWTQAEECAKCSEPWKRQLEK